MDLLEEIGHHSGHSWLVLGNFNEVLHPNEKCSGVGVRFQLAKRLGEVLDICGMMDLGLLGPKYTWSNSRN